jgi:hypothetical protein
MKHALIEIVMLVVAVGWAASCGGSSGNGSDAGRKDETLSCGGSGEPCCGRAVCNAGLTCSSGTCATSLQATDATVDSASNVVAADAGAEAHLSPETGADSGADIGSEGGGVGTPPCEGSMAWECAVDRSCSPSSPTTLQGRVFDPAGANPLYNAMVFIPNVVASLPAITPGTHTCSTCDTPIGDYVIAGQTDATGSFSLNGVPTGTGVPVTVQVGKWRRTVNVNIPTSCATTVVPDGVLRLPRNRNEGDMPQMALLTGGCDDIGCFLMDMGVDPSEFTAPHAGGRVDVYQGDSTPLGLISSAGPSLSNGTAGDCTTTSCPLWASKQSFEAYDIALFSCECSEGTNANESPAAYTNLRDWLNEGGKVFASHYHYTWFEDNPSADFQGVASWGNTGNNDIAGFVDGGNAYNVDTSFPKSAAFGQWLGVVDALSSAGSPPIINLNDVAESVRTVNVPTSRWIYDPMAAEGGTANDVKYLSFETPVGGTPLAADAGSASERRYCGKAAFADLHTSGSLVAQASSIPADCVAATLSPQQKALEFLFFDLSACVADDALAPPPLPAPQ